MVWMVKHSSIRFQIACLLLLLFTPPPHLVQVIDELREILNRVDVVVGGWRDKRDSRLGAPQLRDVRRDLGARQLSALTGLGALGNLWFSR